MPEQAVVSRTILALAKRWPRMRLWRQNTGVGVGWGVVQGAIKAQDWGALRRARPIRFGLPGQADVTGICPDGRRLEVELKYGAGKQREEQKKFQKMIDATGGIYILANSHEEALMTFQERYEQERERHDDEVERLRDMIRWFEHRSGRGDVGLCEDMYDVEVSEGLWEPEGE